ncbi:major facilitator superfamily domain-containing protein [Coniochaeta sp. 2T2.1]|nr:major facilitator superfamily domain-containing protein [Coniochaeta sp. 2T2.1]
MPWGILEDKSGLGHVPGTALLEELNDPGFQHHEHLKKTVHNGQVIILVPQPSDDPNDPLNWPLWSRDLLLAFYSYCCLICIGGVGPILSAMALDLIMEFGITFTDVSLLTGYSLCATGASGLFISAATHKYGKRIPLIFSMIAAFVGTVWAAAAQSHGSLLGARIMQGFCCSMFESVFFSIVGDLYFVHERGVRTAVVTAFIIGISNLPPVLAGKIATELGWRWVFWLLAIFMGIALVGSVLFGWETAYNRSAIYETDVASEDVLDTLDAKRAAAESTHVEHGEGKELASVRTNTTDHMIARKTFVQRMNPYSGTYSDKPLWRLCLDPITVCANPAVIWGICLMSFPTLWIVAINLLIAQIFAAPPFLLTTTELGYMSAGPAIGGTLGSLVAGACSDPLIKLLSRKNNGIYEPEFRLLMIIPAVILSTLSYFLFGSLIEQGKSPVAMATLWGTATASLQFMMMAVGTYCVDAYRSSSVEIFIATMVAKNFLFFGFSYFLNDWVAKWGPVKMFYTIAGIQIGLCLTTVPLWIFGKQIRGWWHKKPSKAH